MKLFVGAFLLLAVIACYDAAVIPDENEAAIIEHTKNEVFPDVNELKVIQVNELSDTKDVNDVTDIKNRKAVRYNLQLGNVGARDRLLVRQYFRKNPIWNTIQYEDFVYRGAASTRISAIYATEVGYTQYASAFLLAGGVNTNYATIRMQSYVGYGYYYQVEIWGR